MIPFIPDKILLRQAGMSEAHDMRRTPSTQQSSRQEPNKWLIELYKARLENHSQIDSSRGGQSSMAHRIALAVPIYAAFENGRAVKTFLSSIPPSMILYLLDIRMVHPIFLIKGERRVDQLRERKRK